MSSTTTDGIYFYRIGLFTKEHPVVKGTPAFEGALQQAKEDMDGQWAGVCGNAGQVMERGKRY